VEKETYQWKKPIFGTISIWNMLNKKVQLVHSSHMQQRKEASAIKSSKRQYIIMV